MDAIKILGSLLGNNATSSGIGGQVLGSLLGGLMGSGAQQQSGSGGLGGLLGGLMGGAQQQGGAGGLGSVLGGLLGGGGAQQGGAGGLGSVLGGLLGGGAQRGGAGGGLGDVLGGLMGGGRPSGGVNWGLLGGLAMTAFQMLGKRGAAADTLSLAGLDKMLDPEQTASPTDEARIQQQALVLIRAMINAAKADGQIDAQEQQNIVSKIADLGPQEIDFLRQEMEKPLNMDFLRDANSDMAPNIYLMSLMAINLDTVAEKQYMQQLAQKLGLNAQSVNDLHQQLGLEPLYA